MSNEIVLARRAEMVHALPMTSTEIKAKLLRETVKLELAAKMRALLEESKVANFKAVGGKAEWDDIEADVMDLVFSGD